MQIYESKLRAQLDDEVWAVLEHNNCFVAGGAITSLFTNRDINDIDIYVPSETALKNVIAHLYCEEDKVCPDSLASEELSQFQGRVCGTTNKAITIVNGKTMLQLVYFKYFSSPDDIFATFDFTVCMGAYDIKQGLFKLHDKFLLDNAARRLSVNSKTDYPLISVMRAFKYIDRGWKISTKEMMLLLLACNNLNIDSWDEVKEQVGGMYGYSVDDIFDTTVDFSICNAIEQLGKVSCDKLYTDYPFKSYSYEDLLKEIGI